MFQEVTLKQAIETKPTKGKAGTTIDSKTLQQIKKLVEATEGQAGAPIRVLQKVQGLIGYLPPEVLEAISREMKIPLSEVYGIVTFYQFFTMVPRGRHVIQICLGTSCYVKGGQKLLEALKRELGLEPGKITPDGRFSLDAIRCLGACALSPVMSVGSDIHRKVNPTGIKELLAMYR